MILTYSQQQQLKPVATNDKKRFEQIMSECEEFEISKLLGIAFYQHVEANKEDYTDLLNGSTFTYCGETISHKGLNSIIAYLNYASYIEESNIIDTATGMKHKTTEQSEHLGVGTIKNLQTKNRELAMLWWDTTKKYLNENTALYPLWNCVTSKVSNKSVFYGIKSI